MRDWDCGGTTGHHMFWWRRVRHNRFAEQQWRRSGGTNREGVQQPYTARDAQYEGIDALSVSVSVYPNPTADNITLECDQPTQLTFTLYNANGQVLSHGNYQGGQQTIDLQKYAAGSYMLHVASPDNTKMNIYKIIKAK